MSWKPEDLKKYDKDILFQVGQFVEIDLPEVPIEHRECTWGVITGINTRFPLSPKLRKIRYTIKLAGLYIKKECRLQGGLRGEFVCGSKHLTIKL